MYIQTSSLAFWCKWNVIYGSIWWVTGSSGSLKDDPKVLRTAEWKVDVVPLFTLVTSHAPVDLRVCWITILYKHLQYYVRKNI